MTRERLASLANKYIHILLVIARLAFYLASDGVLSLPILVTIVALRTSGFLSNKRGNSAAGNRLSVAPL